MSILVAVVVWGFYSVESILLNVCTVHPVRHRLRCVQSSHLDNSKSKSNDPLLQHLKASAFFSERLSLGRQEILSVYPVEIPHHLVDGDVIKGSASESTRLMWMWHFCHLPAPHTGLDDYFQILNQDRDAPNMSQRDRWSSQPEKTRL